jgi:tight adherence protein C
MNPLPPAIALTCCYLLAVKGWTMTRDGGPVNRFAQAAATEEDAVPERGLIFRWVDWLSDYLAPRATRMMGGRQLASVRRKLDAAGKPTSIEGYAGRKAAYLVLFGVPGLFFLFDGLWFVFVGMVVLGWVWPDILISGQARRRQAQIERDLPDFLDILAVTVGAGVGFRPAMSRVADALGGPLGEEVRTSLRQMDLGASRRQAFESLRRRNESESLSTFVTALLQAEELGVPLAQALSELAGDMRRSFHQNARRRAARAAPRVSLITTLLIVPGAMLLIVVALYVGSDIDFGSLFGG